LYQHLIQTHADVTSEELEELEAKHAKCPICQNLFRNQEVLKNHMKKHQERISIDTKTIIEMPVYPTSSTDDGPTSASRSPAVTE
jgi:uncharacterized C2H2 Zn-finger protein